METNQPIIDTEAIKQLNDYINQYQAMRNLAIDSMVKTLSNLPNHNNELELEDEVYVKPNHFDVVKITSVRILEDEIYVRDECDQLHCISFFYLDDVFEIFKQFQKAVDKLKKERLTSFEGLIPSKIEYIMDEYIDPNTRLLCSVFIVRIEGFVVYEKDLGSCGDIVEAIREYLNSIKKQ